MASPAPTATLCQLARQGWPLLVAVLLTLLLGWSALHEGRDNGPAANGWQAQAEDLQQVMPMPAAGGRVPAPCRASTGAAAGWRGHHALYRTGSPRAALVVHVPLWRSNALRWQLHDPALRLNPGHAPPAPHAS